MKILNAHLGDRNADSIKARHIDGWGGEMRDAGYAPGYIKRVAAVLSSAYSVGVR